MTRCRGERVEVSSVLVLRSESLVFKRASANHHDGASPVRMAQTPLFSATTPLVALPCWKPRRLWVWIISCFAILRSTLRLIFTVSHPSPPCYVVFSALTVPPLVLPKFTPCDEEHGRTCHYPHVHSVVWPSSRVFHLDLQLSSKHSAPPRLKSGQR